MAPSLSWTPILACRICARSNLRAKTTASTGLSYRAAAATPKLDKLGQKRKQRVDQAEAPPAPVQESGAMSRRLEQATEDAVLTGGASGRRAVLDTGFSEELKTKLLKRIGDGELLELDGRYAASPVSSSSLPSAAGQGTRFTAAAQPWTGSETTEDAVLRMLDDSCKPLKPGSRGKYQPPPVDMRLKRTPDQSPGQRAAGARDKASMYASMGFKGSKGLSQEERDELKREFRERFQPGARSMPVSASGLASLANERIENAIASGQFKNLPRGKGAEREMRADNPFVDTTEGILNRMIQRQDMVPPWIEKQQDLVKKARVFRQRLRNDWKRHAAMVIAAAGGSLQEQMKRADDYAAAERLHNPRRQDAEQTVVPANSTHDAVMRQTCRSAEAEPAASADNGLLPFRDGDWERTEMAYMQLSIEELNKAARSYNLMAPALARKPYFSLQRELATCFADVAPLVSGEIRQRAAGGAAAGRPRAVRQCGGGGGGGRDTVQVHVEAADRAYGLREWWADLWKPRRR